MQMIAKIAIVTGAGSGIGKEMRRHFSNEGAKVADRASIWTRREPLRRSSTRAAKQRLRSQWT